MQLNTPLWKAGHGALAALILVSMLAAGCTKPRIKSPIFSTVVQATDAPILWKESFDALDSARWKEVEVSGNAEYSIVDLEDRRCLQAKSSGGASIMLSELRFQPVPQQWVSWDWRVDRHVVGEALTSKEGSDVAARVYVYFASKGISFPWDRPSIDYVWSANLPLGTVLESPFSSSSKIIVAASGRENTGEWMRIARNIQEDYRLAFGGEAPEVVAIGVMTDSDNTKGESLSYFDNLEIGMGPGDAAL